MKDETQEIFAFKNQVDNDSMSISSSEGFASLDDWVDESRQTKTFFIVSLIRGRKPKRQKTEDSRPVAFVPFNASLLQAKQT